MKKRRAFFVLFAVVTILFICSVTYSQEIQLTPEQKREYELLRQEMPDVAIFWNVETTVPYKIANIRSAPLILSPQAIKNYFIDNFRFLYRIREPEKEVVTGKIMTDRQGFSNVSIYQKYEGLPVYGVSLKLSLDRMKRLQSIRGKWIPGIDLNTVPRLSQTEVMEVLLGYFKEKYTGPESIPSDIQFKPDKIELVVFNPGVYTGSFQNNYLAYHVILGDQVFFVDAQTGEILYQYSNIQDARIRETHTHDHCYCDLPGTLIIDETGPVGGAIPDAETQNAHDFAGLTYDYYWNTHGRNSFDDSGAVIVQTVHSGVVEGAVAILCCLIDCDLFCCTCNQANAAWIPSFNQVVYGDGGELSDGRTVGPLCNALDVVAHELTHAVTAYSIFDINGDPVGLDYTEQSGALNESFSDFFAAMIDRDDWLMAEDIFDNDALRSLADPTLHGQPDHMDNYVAGGDVHLNSGIPNKVAYLIAEGGVHPHSGIAVNGIGRDAAEKILYRTLTQKLDQTSTFLDARAGALEACEELYPGDTEKFAAVWDAFAACGICDPADPATCQVYEAREPVDIMLVLDLSGSMLSPACPGCDSKLDVLKDSVELFVQVMTELAVPEDRVGVAYFRTDITNFEIGGEVLLPVLSHSADIIADVQAQTTVGLNLTAMGGGLQWAINMLVDESRPQNIIVFTNGMQNVNPMVKRVADPSEPDGFHLEIDNEPGRPFSNISPTSPQTVIDENLGITISSIAVGAGDPYLELLEDIAEKTGGISRFTTAPDDDLRRFYIEELVSVLQQHSPQLLAYRYGTLGSSPALEEFDVAENAKKIVFKTSWERGRTFSVRIFKDDVEMSEYARLTSGPFYSISSLELPVTTGNGIVDSEGTWRLQIEGQKGTDYEIAAIVDEPKFAYEFSLGEDDYRVGDPVEIFARINYGGVPVTDADEVKVTVLKPGMGMGTLLSVKGFPSEPEDFQTEKGILESQKKLQLLLMREDAWAKVQPKKRIIFMGHRQDGMYTAVFENTDVPGIYTFVFEIEGMNPTTGPYSRTESISTLVSFRRAERKKSYILMETLKRTEDVRNLRLYLRPRDSFGNYLGPDYGDQISITISQGEVTGAVQDGVDGSYTVPLIIPRGKDPMITIRVLDHTLFEGPISKLEKGYPFTVSVHSGIAFPSGNYAKDLNPGFSIILDAGYRISTIFSASILFGFHQFRTELSGADDPHVINISAHLRYHQQIRSRLSLYLGGGIGLYVPETEENGAGFNAGLGVLYDIKPRLILELGSDYHNVFGSDIQFFQSHAGLNVRF
jgi:Zn-dependent metalloprotease